MELVGLLGRGRKWWTPKRAARRYRILTIQEQPSSVLLSLGKDGGGEFTDGGFCQRNLLAYQAHLSSQNLQKDRAIKTLIRFDPLAYLFQQVVNLLVGTGLCGVLFFQPPFIEGAASCSCRS